jgi:hypothetical protein
MASPAPGIVERGPLTMRKARIVRRIAKERAAIGAGWQAVEGTVAEKEWGLLVAIQGLRMAVRWTGIATAIWLVGRPAGNNLWRRVLIRIAAARTAGKLLSSHTFRRG